MTFISPPLSCRLGLTQAACAVQGPPRAVAFASITDSIKNAASRVVDNVRGAKEDVKEVCEPESVSLPWQQHLVLPCRCLGSMTHLFQMGTRTPASTRRHPRRLSLSLRIEGEGLARCMGHFKCAVMCDRCGQIC